MRTLRDVQKSLHKKILDENLPQSHSDALYAISEVLEGIIYDTTSIKNTQGISVHFTGELKFHVTLDRNTYYDEIIKLEES